MCRQNIKLRFLIICASSFLIIQLGCGIKDSKLNKKHSVLRMLMGTVVQIDVCRDQADILDIESAYKDVWQRLEVISRRMNVADESSDVAKINRSGRGPVPVAEDTYYVLKKSIDFSRLTDGAFDITVRPLMELWRESERNNTFPEQNAITRVQSFVDSRNIQLLNDNHVQLLNNETKIDLGGIAKGYAVDEAARILRKHGIRQFFIDAGGDIYVGGKNCAGEAWRIGIRDPRDRSKIIDIIPLTNKAIVTSGDYEQYYQIQGQKWSHIINPITGYPQKEVVSATVIAQSAIEADALATALCVLGGDPGTVYMDALEGQQASLIMTQQEIGRIQEYESKEYKKLKYRK